MEKERELSVEQVVPTVTLGNSIADLKSAFRFEPYIDRSPERVGTAIDAWKTTVVVQQHFNELGMKVRNFALTIVGAVLAGATFSVKEQVEITVRGNHIPLAALILSAGIVVWIAFYLMDRHWYHKLLLGAVGHGITIEKRYQNCLPELGLATAIGAASPTVLPLCCFGQWKMRSSVKLDLFYLVGTFILFAAAIGSFWIGKNADSVGGTKASTKSAVSTAPVAEPENERKIETPKLNDTQQSNEETSKLAPRDAPKSEQKEESRKSVETRSPSDGEEKSRPVETPKSK